MSPISAFTARRTRHLLLSAAILSASVLAGSLAAPDTRAQTSACASDPEITFANGDVMDLSTVLPPTQPVQDVSGVTYVISMPSDTHVVNEADTAALGISGKDSISYQANEPANSHTYAARVKVSTAKSGVPWTLSMKVAVTVQGKKGPTLSSGDVTGYTPQTLSVGVTG
jgi:hypothetical protein